VLKASTLYWNPGERGELTKAKDTFGEQVKKLKEQQHDTQSKRGGPERDVVSKDKGEPSFIGPGEPRAGLDSLYGSSSEHEVEEQGFDKQDAKELQQDACCGGELFPQTQSWVPPSRLPWCRTVLLAPPPGTADARG
jgi:hypothetical protein